MTNQSKLPTQSKVSNPNQKIYPFLYTVCSILMKYRFGKFLDGVDGDDADLTSSSMVINSS